MKEITIRELVERSHALSLEKGWYERSIVTGKARTKAINEGEKLMLIVTEVAEAMEAYRNHGVRRRCPECSGLGYGMGDGGTKASCEACGHKGFEEWWLENGKPEGLVIELADAMIRIADLCGAFGLDLAGAIELKHVYNEGRSYRHGNKRA